MSKDSKYSKEGKKADGSDSKAMDSENVWEGTKVKINKIIGTKLLTGKKLSRVKLIDDAIKVYAANEKININ